MYIDPSKTYGKNQLSVVELSCSHIRDTEKMDFFGEEINVPERRRSIWLKDMEKNGLFRIKIIFTGKDQALNRLTLWDTKLNTRRKASESFDFEFRYGKKDGGSDFRTPQMHD